MIVHHHVTILFWIQDGGEAEVKINLRQLQSLCHQNPQTFSTKFYTVAENTAGIQYLQTQPMESM